MAEQPRQGDDRFAALLSNVEAVRAMARSVEGTIGPKGLDTMLVDPSGHVLVTNDGITILREMEATHPAARMVVGLARAQEEAVGDGTTTATLLAAAMLAAAAEHALRGVPVSRLVQGLRLGVERAVHALESLARPVAGPGDPLVRQVAVVAGRGHADLAGLVVRTAQAWGAGALADPAFRLADSVRAWDGAASDVVPGVVLGKGRMDRQQPPAVKRVRALVLDDALAPEEVDSEALATEAGFRQYRDNRQAFLADVARLVEAGANLVICDRGVDDEAAQLLTDAGVMVVQRVAMAEWQRAAEHLGARVVRRGALRRDLAQLRSCLGRGRAAVEDERSGCVRLTGGAGRPMATLLVGAATAEVAAERERIARDAAAAVQQAVRGGVVPGGGAAELAAARAVAAARGQVTGMAGYGAACVAEALKEPLARIVANAGWNALEKVEAAWVEQERLGSGALALDCDTGLVADMWAVGVVDPAPVKVHAVRAAGELAEAVLRIDAVVRRRSPETGPGARRDRPTDSQAGGLVP